MKHSVNWYTPTSLVYAWQVPGAIYLSTDLYEITRNNLYIYAMPGTFKGLRLDSIDKHI
jgi:hypothetical protein